ncbi:MAG TPA: long-chain fatty acid--CoA ligase [Terriglobales bacterium]|nr:long-chain fatty acid--CoA ligase [Terriglobales bacterium]
MAGPGIPSELPQDVPTRARSAAEFGCGRLETTINSVAGLQPSSGVSLRTVNDVFFSIVESDQASVMLHREAIEWISISSRELYRNVVGVARALESWGISKGDRVAILSENRPEWSTADFATLLLGGVVVPVYSTLTDEQTAYVLSDSGARVVFVSTDKQLQKVLAIQGRTKVEKIVVMDPVETAHALHMYRLMNEGPDARDPQFDVRAMEIAPDDLATIIYTSGTTGTPKGAMLTHGNLASNISCSLQEFEVRPGQISLSFLPLSHVTARHVDFAMMYHGVTLAYCPFIEQLPRALLEVRPTIFVGVPRVYEKIYNQVVQRTKGLLKSAIYAWALAVGHRHKQEILSGRRPTTTTWRVADKLIYSQVRAALGGRVGLFISGGAPLGRELAEWYATIGIRIHEGYGLTETSPVIAVNTPKAHKLGTVGKPLRNLEVRIAEDGEILVRGPSVFQAYWNRPEETRNAFLEDWFKTGDIGNIDAAGFLSITDRKKDLIKTSGGKFIAPQPIENSLKHNVLIAEAVILGDKRKFPAVLIAPHFPLLEDWARTNHVPFSSRKELVQHSVVQALYEGIVADLNQTLARFEKLKKVIVVPDEFSPEDGTLTASLKLRRRVIEERYRHDIDRLYAQADSMPAD